VKEQYIPMALMAALSASSFHFKLQRDTVTIAFATSVACYFGFAITKANNYVKFWTYLRTYNILQTGGSISGYKTSAW
jgi:uncharacterized integral membrane protein